MFGRGSGSVQDPACYEHIEEKSNEDFKVEEAPRKTVPSLKRLPFWSLISPWKISTFILLVYSVFSIISIESECKPWSPTDLKVARSLIKESAVTFTSSLEYTGNLALVRSNKTGPQYVGKPNPEIDEAWNEINSMPSIYLTRKEAKAEMQITDNTYFDYNVNKYPVGVEGFHHIHCLNYIRKSMDPNYYQEQAADKNLRVHTEHCIDSLREFVMCKSDMTLITWVKSPHIPRPLPDFHTTHICRDYGKLYRWAQTRSK